MAFLVGQIFISGYYESLGYPDENVMIVSWKECRLPEHRIVIGFVGPIATGKLLWENTLQSIAISISNIVKPS